MRAGPGADRAQLPVMTPWGRVLCDQYPAITAGDGRPGTVTLQRPTPTPTLTRDRTELSDRRPLPVMTRWGRVLRDQYPAVTLGVGQPGHPHPGTAGPSTPAWTWTWTWTGCRSRAVTGDEAVGAGVCPVTGGEAIEWR
jgi:hypothetical protein